MPWQFKIFLLLALGMIGCSGNPRVVVLMDPYGALAFPNLQGIIQDSTEGLPIDLVVKIIPVQAEVEGILELVPQDTQILGIFCPDIYEEKIFDELKTLGKVASWGYEEASKKAELSWGWDNTPALVSATKQMGIQALLKTPAKPLIFSLILGPEGTQTREEAAVRAAWPKELGQDTLWILRLNNLDDRNAATQNANTMLSLDLDAVFLLAGKQNTEIFRILAGGGVRLGVQDWDFTKREPSSVIFSLERNWPLYWKSALKSLYNGEVGAKEVNKDLEYHISQENTLLEPQDIR